MDIKGNFKQDERGNRRGIRNYLALLLTLIKLKSNFSFQFLSYWFGIGVTQATIIFKHMSNCLLLLFKTINTIHLLPLEERLARGHWFNKEIYKVSHRCTLFGDGNLTPTSSAPTKSERTSMHSGKESIECVSLIGFVDGLGKVNHLSNSFPGSIPDVVSLNFQGVVDFVSLVTQDEYIVVDAAFPRIREYCDNVLIPIYPKPEMDHLNNEISKYRSLIERCWCQLEKWKIIQKYRIGWNKNTPITEIMQQHNNTMFIIASIYNIFNEPLGEPTTIPSPYGNIQYSTPNLYYHRQLLDRCGPLIEK